MKTSAAIGEIRKFHKFIKAFEHLEEVADELEGAENLIKERGQRLAEIEAHIETATGKVHGGNCNEVA